MSFYAVRKGFRTGVVSTWDECQNMVKGFSGAEFKKFKTKEEAQGYLDGTDFTSSRVTIVKPQDNELHLYCDGSYKDGVASFGLFAEDAQRDWRLFGLVLNNNYTSMRNISGEVAGVLVGLCLAGQLGKQHIKVFCDYEGLEYWYTGEWRSKSDLAKAYVSAAQGYLNGSQNGVLPGINKRLDFIHVKGHSGVKGNVMADNLANRAYNFPQSIDFDALLKGTFLLSSTGNI